ncbi:putative oxidoreductase C-terminal domain-containing protein [Chondrinema litorale]|uniref:putative oxidoreductase C-terminal domain-containing protein n=1 Tax=Chondrinema litorale TaxID=2994555 RepID=UPI0025436ABE|nr:putative oxidoreductase C-terminal domain-containing protein [Chondrinema litorale]UZR98669.1 Gfo/Idh/MocA family oxidoreductase [Chondrinema litorale]
MNLRKSMLTKSLIRAVATAFAIAIVSGACTSPQSGKMEDKQEEDIPKFSGEKGEVVLMTVDPGHFHSALVQKFMYPQISPKAYVFAPEGDDVQQHLSKIELYNSREDQPTNWEEVVYTGDDFFEKMLAEKPGNVMMVAGNNGKKTEYISEAVKNNIHVLADKPMVIEPAEFELLKSALEEADKKGLLVYDIMTERFEISTIMQKELSAFPEVFGDLEKGTPENPAISKESVHHFFKYVSGLPLKRPTWFFDIKQQGEGIVDVSTHLVDLILWECFPEQGIDYKTETEVISGKRWPTSLSSTQFEKVTGETQFPDFLNKDVVNDSLQVYANGEIIFTTRGVHGKASVIWNFEAPEGAKDTHFSMMRGTKANLIIRQDAPQNYQPTLYVEPVAGSDAASIEAGLKSTLASLANKYPGMEMKKSDNGWEIIIPEKYKNGHEAHFSQVTEKYLEYLKEGKIPDWEKQNIITKYFITTEAYKLSHQNTSN